jgi:hypothetical protein
MPGREGQNDRSGVEGADVDVDVELLKWRTAELKSTKREEAVGMYVSSTEKSPKSTSRDGEVDISVLGAAMIYILFYLAVE